VVLQRGERGREGGDEEGFEMSTVKEGGEGRGSSLLGASNGRVSFGTDGGETLLQKEERGRWRGAC
jgi:hypothetical protein